MIVKEEIAWDIALFIAAYKKSPPDERTTNEIADDMFNYLLEKLDHYCDD